MKYLEEFRDGAVAQRLAGRIQAYAGRPVNLMEVCGTHTVAIFRHGIRQLLPPNVRMLSGPGCPVCVTANADLDKAIALAQMPGVILTTFGDMLKVPGSYSFAVGFETTAPTIAASVAEAQRQGLGNYSIVSVHKLVPPALRALLDSGELRIDGLLLPGHVSAIIGSAPYQFIARDYGIPCVIAGFEPLDVLQGIALLLAQITAGEARVEIQYRRAVPPQGNPAALAQMHAVFQPGDAEWRGLGAIPASGLRLRDDYAAYDAERRLAIQTPPPKEQRGCRCGEVLRGVIAPPECALFGQACTPENPLGPCMVSFEGTCAAWYNYGGA